MPWADVNYFADARWWSWHREKPEFQAFRGQRVTIEGGDGNCDPASRAALHEALARNEVWWLHNHSSTHLSDRPNGLATGMNSGYQALNLAILAGASKVLLLGYDMKAGAGGVQHWFGNHPVVENPGIYSAFLNCFRKVAPRIQALGVKVINCSPDSALDCFERDTIENATRIHADQETAALSL